MSIRTVVLGIVWLAFSAFTLEVLAEWGIAGFLGATLANGATLQVGIDLVIMVTLFLLWMIGDARERGINPWPFVLLACGLGSIGAMAYLLWRERAALPAQVRAGA